MQSDGHRSHPCLNAIRSIPGFLVLSLSENCFHPGCAQLAANLQFNLKVTRNQSSGKYTFSTLQVGKKTGSKIEVIL